MDLPHFDLPNSLQYHPSWSGWGKREQQDHPFLNNSNCMVWGSDFSLQIIWRAYQKELRTRESYFNICKELCFRSVLHQAASGEDPAESSRTSKQAKIFITVQKHTKQFRRRCCGLRIPNLRSAERKQTPATDTHSALDSKAPINLHFRMGFFKYN